jgi:hypothetical protein
VATLLKPMKLANPGKRRNRKMTAKQIKYFGTKRQRAALKGKSGIRLKNKYRRSKTKSSYKQKEHTKSYYGSAYNRPGRRYVRKNVGRILVASNRGHRKRRNIAAGYYDSTGFHPIRASYDYDPEEYDYLPWAEKESGRYKTGRKTYRGKGRPKSKRRKNPSMPAQRNRRYRRRRNRTPVANRHHRRRRYNRTPRANRYHRRRRNPGRVVRYRNRGRRMNRRHHRRNPSFNGITSQFVRVGGLIAGAYVTQMAMGFVSNFSATFGTGIIGYLATAVVAYLQGKFIGKMFKNPALGQSMTEGGYVYLALKVASDMGFSSMLPFGLSGFGRRGMGLITPNNFYVPQVPQRGSMGSFLVPPGVPRPVIVPAGSSGALRGITTNAVGGGRMGMRRVGRMS